MTSISAANGFFLSPAFSQKLILFFRAYRISSVIELFCPACRIRDGHARAKLNFVLMSGFFYYVSRHQITHYTGQLAKDTSGHLRDINDADLEGLGDARQFRLQKERLRNDFTKALNSFQAAQRTAAQKEKEAFKRAKAAGGQLI